MSDLIFNHTVSADGTVKTISIAGRLAIDTAAELHGFLKEQLADEPDSVIVDLAGLDDIDIAGVQMICSACRTIQQGGRKFQFGSSTAEALDHIKNQLGITHITQCKYKANTPCIWFGGLN
jgi:anti-anti-sigma regulatory factor